MEHLLTRKDEELMDRAALKNNLHEVVFLESIGGFTRKYCVNGRELLVESGINHMEQILPHDKFFKINDSFIINADYLKRIKANATKNAILHGGIELRIAQDKYWEFVSFLRFKYKI
ncbi:MAG: hypothetical protein C0597_12420 [Marinilabiliales bacterium]|nr:MAG: hypothetical protein C0597_12420 [Marinilabiliales bacterium]